MGMSALEGAHARIRGKAAIPSQGLVPWVLLPSLAPSSEEPGTSLPMEASKAFGQLPSPQPPALESSSHAGLPSSCLELIKSPLSFHFLRLQE